MTAAECEVRPRRDSSCGRFVPRLLATLLLAGCSGAPDDSRAATIRIERVMTLQGAGDSARFAAYPYAVRRLASGALVVSPEPYNGRGDVLPRRFDAAGRFQSTIGRIGDGPGEFREPVAWGELGGDSLLVADVTLRRASVFGTDGSVARTFPLPVGARTVLVGSDRSLVANVPSGTSGGTWAPLTRIDREGKVAASFGGDSTGCGRLCGLVGVRLLAADADGAVWAARQLEDFVLERYDREGRRTRSLHIAADWFPSLDSFPPAPGDRFPFSIINSIALDSAGRLWIAGSTADPDWESSLGPARPGEGGTTYRPVADVNRYRDGILDIRDTTTGALIAQHRFTDSPILLLVEPGLLAQVRTDDDGWHVIDILRVSVGR